MPLKVSRNPRPSGRGGSQTSQTVDIGSVEKSAGLAKIPQKSEDRSAPNRLYPDHLRSVVPRQWANYRSHHAQRCEPEPDGDVVPRAQALRLGQDAAGELLYHSLRNRWTFNWSVQMPAPVARPGRVAGIDLGIRVLASLSIEGLSQSVHFAGRDVLKEWRYWNRQLARHQQEIAHRNKKSSKRLRRLYAKRKARLRHA